MQPTEISNALFADRKDAGRRLADALSHLREQEPAVLGLPRGGVIVAAEIATKLCVPLDVVVSRKLGTPFQPELGIGAVASGNVAVIDRNLVQRLHISEEELDAIRVHALEELQRREHEYRQVLPPIPLNSRVAIVVDDGLATGVTALAAVRSVRQQQPRQIVAAFPVASPGGMELLAKEADEVVCLMAPPQLRAVGQWYTDFTQTTDEEVIDALGRQPC